MNDFTSLEQVRKTFRLWRHEGKKMPGYLYGEGDTYIIWLLDLNITLLEFNFEYKSRKDFTNFTQSILGPNGYTYLRTLIAKAKERERERY